MLVGLIHFQLQWRALICLEHPSDWFGDAHYRWDSVEIDTEICMQEIYWEGLSETVWQTKGSPMEQKEKLTCCAVATKVLPDPSQQLLSQNVLQRCLNWGRTRLLYPPINQSLEAVSSQEGQQLLFARTMPGEELSYEPSLRTPSSSVGLRVSILKGRSVATTMDKYERAYFLVLLIISPSKQ